MQFDGWRFWRCYVRDWRSRDRRRLKWQWSFRWDSRLLRCRCTSSRFVREKGTSGRRDIGRGMTTTEIITGCREPGYWHRKWDICGRRVIGVGVATLTFSTWATGDRWWDSMAELITVGATTDAGTTVDGGITTIFITTAK